MSLAFFPLRFVVSTANELVQFVGERKRLWPGKEIVYEECGLGDGRQEAGGKRGMSERK